jgi:hypothetical protein
LLAALQNTSGKEPFEGRRHREAFLHAMADLGV